mmetsp:Transcript_797/g.1281  ORF Transcript_797/g.1281 Transcript_797/m.1281 type:complete len:279 (-) Transcript_797:3775-4611(-)
MVARPLHNCRSQRVANTKPFASTAICIQHTACGSIQARVANNHRFGRVEERSRRRDYNDLAPVHALAHVVVGLTHHLKRHARHDECSKALSCGTCEVQHQLSSEAIVTISPSNFPSNTAAYRSVCVENGDILLQAGMRLNGLQHSGVGQDVVVQHGAVGVGHQRQRVLLLHRRCQHVVHSERVGFAERHILTSLEQVESANQLIQRLVSHLGQDVSSLLRNKREKVDHITRNTNEASTEVLTLRCHPHRAIVGMANARHDTTGGDHSNGTKAVLVCAH